MKVPIRVPSTAIDDETLVLKIWGVLFNPTGSLFLDPIRPVMEVLFRVPSTAPNDKSPVWEIWRYVN